MRTFARESTRLEPAIFFRKKIVVDVFPAKFQKKIDNNYLQSPVMHKF